MQPFSFHASNIVQIVLVFHTMNLLFHRTVKTNGGTAPLTYQKFQTIAAKMGAPIKPLPKPTSADLKGILAFFVNLMYV